MAIITRRLFLNMRDYIYIYICIQEDKTYIVDRTEGSLFSFTNLANSM